ncbi:MAG: magnesium-translocating P-type ATPase [Acidobacteriota bacterium]|nr:magnesium-translocating P-type ATPase [Acidobacteriota bacterium]
MTKTTRNRTRRSNPTGVMEQTWLSYIATLDVAAAYDELRTRRAGLSPAEVEASREAHGANLMAQARRTPAALRLLRAVGDPFVLILLALGAVSFATDVVFAAPRARDAATPLLIAAMALVSVLLRLVQETRGADAAAALAETIETTCCVERMGVGRAEIPLDEVVVGDVVHLAAGDIVPADLRIVAARDLFVGQSALTGESEAVEKLPSPTDGLVSPPEAANLAFLGTTVISGTGVGVAVRVGKDTELGSVAAHLGSSEKRTAYDRGIRDVSLLLVRLMLVVVPIVFAINVATKGDWLDALLFSLSVAVGLTPEMLPMIVTTCLAKGAVDLSRGRVIVKRLDAIQNLGSIDVLCCDKTGTLTEDRVVLERHLDVMGHEDVRVLHHAFLNSHFATGMRNLIDTAIIRCAHEEIGLEDQALVMDNFLVDELPFDYERRRVSVVVGDEDGHTQMITKGALEEMLSVCSRVELDGETHSLTSELEQEVLDRGRSLSDDGMRVLGVARKDEPAGVGELTVADECDMTLIGYLAFLDPPKADAGAAIEALAAHGVEIKVLTGDSTRVACHVCERLGLDVGGVLEGAQVEDLSDEALRAVVRQTTVYAKLSPGQKSRVVAALQVEGYVVGFMGDGVNDAAAMRTADCGLSVDTGADVAKEAADIILLEKDLMVLERGVEGGRRTFANMNKYVKMTASSNFGNVFSVLVASAFLPFLPMTAVQLLFLNFVYDLTCIAIPWDAVDEEDLRSPRTWDAESLSAFMRWMGPVSSVFDVVTFVLLFAVVCPAACGGAWGDLPAEARLRFAATFQAGWLLESMLTQVLAVHLLRTERMPFVRSRASWQICVLGAAGVAVAALMCLTPIGYVIDLEELPLGAVLVIALVALAYAACVLLVRRAYVARHGRLL